MSSSSYTNMVITVRLANKKSASDITNIGKNSYRQAFASLIPPEQLEKYLQEAYTLEAQTKELNDPSLYTFMAFMDSNTPVGFCQLKEEPKAMKVARLYIDQSYSGKGAGKALMEHVMIKTQELGKRSMWLEVFESNKPAMGLYNKLGFKKVDYYRISLIKEEIVDVMSKELYI